jgi:ACS family hexuronate transporter-like MFS transporter
VNVDADRSHTLGIHAGGESSSSNPPIDTMRRKPRIPLQWLAMAVFWLSFSLNFLDRQLLAALAPTLKSEFALTNTQYGQLVSSFYLVSAIAAPLAGWFIDRVGLRIGAAVAVTIWSLAGAATALTHSFRGLMACRMALGFGESSGFPLLGKATVTYLTPAEMGLAGGFGAISLTLGSVGAPLIVAALAPLFGWRAVFVVCGALGLLWVPLWLVTATRIPPRAGAGAPSRAPARQVLGDRRLWAVALAYCTVYTVYALWANWTTIYLVQERHLTEAEANLRYAWFPPAFAVLGGFAGGGLSFVMIRRGMDALTARVRVCWLTAPLLLACASIPFLPSATQAAAAIGVSFLAFQSLLGSIFLMPLDLFGARHAGVSNAVLAFIAALTQVLASPVIGALVDGVGFTAICVGIPVLPLVGLIVLQAMLPAARAVQSPPLAR